MIQPSIPKHFFLLLSFSKLSQIIFPSANLAWTVGETMCVDLVPVKSIHLLDSLKTLPLVLLHQGKFRISAYCCSHTSEASEGPVLNNDFYD